MKKKKIKRLWNGLASIRDYEREKYIKEGGVILVLKDQQMTLTPEKLRWGMFQTSGRKFPSRFGTPAYSMYDIRFIPDE